MTNEEGEEMMNQEIEYQYPEDVPSALIGTMPMVDIGMVRMALVAPKLARVWLRGATGYVLAHRRSTGSWALSV